jgi:hypothetical protein
MAKEVRKTLTIKDYSRHRKCDKKTILEAVENSRITPIMRGHVMHFDVLKCDADWLANTDSTMNRNPLSHTSEYSEENKKNIKGPTLIQSRSIREAYQAKLAKIEYEEKTDRLINAELVRKQAFEMGRILRDSLLTIPSRISNELIGVNSAFEIEEIIERELLSSLNELSREIKTK